MASASRACYYGPMLPRPAAPLAFALALLAPPVAAGEDGPLGTLPQGRYTCALPGDALGEAVLPLPEKTFHIDNGSTYRTAQGSGTYLLTGDTVRFTRGPMKGMQFERTGHGSLRQLDEQGRPGRERCVRSAR